MPVIGFLSPGTQGERVSALPGFRRGLSEMGFVEGRNVAVEFRFAQNDMSRIPELATDLIRRGVAVIAIAGLIVFGPAVSSLLSKLGGSV